MAEKLKLMCVLAHPDDESLGVGGVLARYASEGIETYVVTATRGERGRFGDIQERPGLDVVGRTREAELRAASVELGVREVSLLDYIDGDLDKAPAAEVAAKIAEHLRRVRPDVVATFGPDGAYGHPDHIAISQFTTAAIVCAADPSFKSSSNGSAPLEPHRVSKLYYMAWNSAAWSAYQSAFRDLKTVIDGTERRATPWPDWAITTQVDTTAHWPVVWRAVQCHKTQLTIYSKLADLPEEHHRAIWGTQQFYRVFSSVNGGRTPETDLFEGLR